MSRRNKDKGRIEGPFVPMLIPTTSSPAWRATSPYAREVYRVLKSRYGPSIKNNGRIYLSTRDGADETGFNEKTVARSLRELQHYGFTVMTKAGCLGLDGKGVSPHWRLTELGYMHEPPTRDFLKWDGEMFHEQKSPAYYKRQERSLARLRRSQKQNPAPLNGADCAAQRSIPALQSAEQLPEKVLQSAVHISDPPCTSERHISRVNHSAAPEFSDLAASSEVKLISGKDKTAQAEKRGVSEERVAVEGTSPTSTEHLVQQVEKTQMTAINGHTCLSREEQRRNDLRGMPADLSKFYPATPTYEWLNSSSENSAHAAA